MREYSKASLWYEKALEIRKKTLPSNHPDIAESYNKLASVCYNMKEYSKAFSYYKSALDIWERSLPSNHHHLQTVRHRIEIVKPYL